MLHSPCSPACWSSRFHPTEAGAIFSIRLWAGMVGGNNAAARLNPQMKKKISLFWRSIEPQTRSVLASLTTRSDYGEYFGQQRQYRNYHRNSDRENTYFAYSCRVVDFEYLHLAGGTRTEYHFTSRLDFDICA